ncbi:MAG: hypothetical protein ACREPR_03445 [Brasilonema sp.]
MKLPSNHKTNQPANKVSSHLEQINHNSAGIDLGGTEHWVCVPIEKAEKNVRPPKAVLLSALFTDACVLV